MGIDEKGTISWWQLAECNSDGKYKKGINQPAAKK